MSALNNYRFTESHEWVLCEDGRTALVGISDYAQKELSDIVFVETPKVGARLAKGKEACVVESVKTASDIYAPADGTVTAVNGKLADTPGLINTHPYTDGWIFKMDLADASQLSALLTAPQYEQRTGH